MKVVGALVAGLVLALAPTGTAFAGEAPKGKAFGNCGVSSAGGKVEHTGAVGNGFGGRVVDGRAGTCTVPADDHKNQKNQKNQKDQEIEENEENEENEEIEAPDEGTSDS